MTRHQNCQLRTNRKIVAAWVTSLGQLLAVSHQDYHPIFILLTYVEGSLEGMYVGVDLPDHLLQRLQHFHIKRFPLVDHSISNFVFCVIEVDLRKPRCLARQRRTNGTNGMIKLPLYLEVRSRLRRAVSAQAGKGESIIVAPDMLSEVWILEQVTQKLGRLLHRSEDSRQLSIPAAGVRGLTWVMSIVYLYIVFTLCLTWPLVGTTVRAYLLVIDPSHVILYLS